MKNDIKNAILMAQGGRASFGTNHPYADNTNERIFANETKEFYRQAFRWSSNVVTARIQGLDYADFYAYQTKRIRTANVIDPTTGDSLGADWQRMLIEDANIDFLPRGAKVEFGGNTWLVMNPKNVNSVIGTSVIRRCNAVWNHLDFYGNVLSEPFCYGHGANDLATADTIERNMILMDAYQHSCMQLNPRTRELAHNMRMILGSQAYTVKGLQNFVQEFTPGSDTVDDYRRIAYSRFRVTEDGELVLDVPEYAGDLPDEAFEFVLNKNGDLVAEHPDDELPSVHIQYFDLYTSEPMDADDMEKRVAGGKTFTWQIAISGMNSMAVGAEQTLQAVSTRNGEPLPDSVQATYRWDSNNPDAVRVDAQGRVEAIAIGSAQITCILGENPAIRTTFDITVANAITESYVAWVELPPTSISRYAERTFSAAYFENGIMTDELVTFHFAGANVNNYSAAFNGNAVTISCWYEDAVPLVVTASSGDKSVSAEIQLLGW